MVWWCGGKFKNIDICVNWECECGHLAYRHAGAYCYCESRQDDFLLKFCKCNKFVYADNKYCTVECQFYRKVWEVENEMDKG